jgi:hypothetical protein
MSYEEILKELEEVNLKDKFTSVYEGFVSDSFLERLRNTDKIHSTGSLIRSLLIFFENESEDWIYWQKILVYFMTPKFARKENQLL